MKEKIKLCARQAIRFLETYRMALSFFENLHKLWGSEQTLDKQTFLKFEFEEGLLFAKK
jgi:hypothetical protein